MPHSSMIHIRIDEDIMALATVALAAMGLAASDAVRILLKRMASDQAFPLELKVPNARTRAAIREARSMARARPGQFDFAVELLDELGHASRRSAARASSKR